MSKIKWAGHKPFIIRPLIRENYYDDTVEAVALIKLTLAQAKGRLWGVEGETTRWRRSGLQIIQLLGYDERQIFKIRGIQMSKVYWLSRISETEFDSYEEMDLLPVLNDVEPTRFDHGLSTWIMPG